VSKPNPQKNRNEIIFLDHLPQLGVEDAEFFFRT